MKATQIAQLDSPAAWQRAYLQHDGGVEAFYRAPAFDFPGHSPDRPLSPEAVAEWRALLHAHGASDSATAPLEALANPQTRVVVTGQQAGAALGPLYTLYKAIGAIKHAERLSAERTTPHLAVFWVASDDHDLDEVASATWLSSDGSFHRASISAEGPDAGRRSVSHEPIDPAKWRAFIEEFTTSTNPTEFRPALLDALEASAANNATFESAFLRFAVRWLLPLGIFPIVPRLSFLRRGAVPIFQREVASFAETNQSVVETGARLEEHGVEAPLHRSGNELNFFLEVGDIRGKVTSSADSFIVTDPKNSESVLLRCSREELLHLLATEHGRFSPNAVLRPLVQDAVLPTVGYVGGPSEVLYHAQIGGLYAAFDVPRPAILPRPNVVLVEGKVEKALKRLGLALEDAPASSLTDFEAAVRHAAQNNAQSQKTDSATAALRDALAALDVAVRVEAPDPAVDKTVARLREGVDTGLAKLSERLAAHFASRDGESVKARERAVAFLFPEGQPQERTIGMLAPLLNQFGEGILATLKDRIDPRAVGVRAIRIP